MSYADTRQNRTVTIGAVVVVHAAIGYALLTGLATTVITRFIPEPMQIYEVKDPVPPPPDLSPPPPADKIAQRTMETLSPPIRQVEAPGEGPIVIASLEPQPGPMLDGSATTPAEPASQPTVSLARGVLPRGNEGSWFPQDSYPAAARRAEAEGTVSVRVTVGADGRVSDCAVTTSSGNADLDGATCRLAKRNGRFEPARDDQGMAVPSSFTLRNVRWLLQ